MSDSISDKWLDMFQSLKTDAHRRSLAAGKATEIGNIRKVHKATGLAINTIKQGIKELKDPSIENIKASRGSLKIEVENPKLLDDLASILAIKLNDNPILLCKMSLKSFAGDMVFELNRKGYDLSHQTVLRLLTDHEEQLNKSIYMKKMEFLTKISKQKSGAYYGKDIPGYFDGRKVKPRKGDKNV